MIRFVWLLIRLGIFPLRYKMEYQVTMVMSRFVLRLTSHFYQTWLTRSRLSAQASNSFPSTLSPLFFGCNNSGLEWCHAGPKSFPSILTNNLLHILKMCNSLLPLRKSLLMADSKKQERAIVHLEIDGRHYYYGNLKALTDHWPKETLGVSYTYLKNLNIDESKPYQNDKCIIRRGIIITSPRKDRF